MNGGTGHLLVRAAGRVVGLPLSLVSEVLDPGEVFPVPSTDPACRGVVVVRGRIVPLVHLGALLEGYVCPAARGEAAVLVALAGGTICLEIDAAESVLYQAGLPVPAGAALPWAAAVVQTEGGLVPLLDLAALGARISETTAA